VLNQKHKQLQRKTFQANGIPAAIKLKAAEIQLEFGKTDFLFGHENPQTRQCPQFLSASAALSSAKDR